MGIPTVVILRELPWWGCQPVHFLTCTLPLKLPHKTTCELWDQKDALEGSPELPLAPRVVSVPLVAGSPGLPAGSEQLGTGALGIRDGANGACSSPMCPCILTQEQPVWIHRPGGLALDATPPFLVPWGHPGLCLSSLRRA